MADEAVASAKRLGWLAATRSNAWSDLALTLPRNLTILYDLHLFELPFNVETLNQYLYWHKSADQDQASIWMRNLLLGMLG